MTRPERPRRSRRATADDRDDLGESAILLLRLGTPGRTERRIYTVRPMFDTLSDKLQHALGDLRGKGRLDEDAISKAMREIRLALLEADVNFQVVKDFVAQVRERATGQDVLKSLTAGQQVVKIVHEELTDADGLRRLAARLRAPADRDPARRPAGLRQDDHLRQARAAAAQGRQEAGARRRRPAASGRDRPARAARPPDPDPGLPQGHAGSRRGRQVRDPGGADRRPGRRHPRHRRPPARRRGR